jgi:hypothetical protein
MIPTQHFNGEISMNAVIGLGILSATGALFWRTLPRNGKMHRLVGTEWEPYFAIAFVGGAALGVGLIALWAVETLL